MTQPNIGTEHTTQVLDVVASLSCSPLASCPRNHSMLLLGMRVLHNTRYHL